jgi:hypothetical protein
VRDFLRDAALDFELEGLDARPGLDLEALLSRARVDLTGGRFGDLDGGLTDDRGDRSSGL